MKKIFYLFIFIFTMTCFTSCSKNINNGILYIKENSLLYKSPSSNDSIILTDEIYSYDDDTFSRIEYQNYVQFNDSKERIFYCSNIKLMDYTYCFNLYFKDLNDNSQPVLVSDEVEKYIISPDGNSLIYKKNDSSLYYNDFNDAKLISEDVIDFMFSDDFKKVAYSNHHYMYIYDLETGKTNKISSKYYLRLPHNFNGNMNTFFTETFIDDDMILFMHKYDNLENPVQVSKDYHKFITSYDNGSAYFLEKCIEKIPAISLLDQESLSKFPNSTLKYLEKKETKFSKVYISYFDGNEKYILGQTQNYISYSDVENRINTTEKEAKATFILQESIHPENMKIPYSKLMNINFSNDYELENLCWEILNSAKCNLYLSIGKDVILLDENVYFQKLSPSGEKVYYCKYKDSSKKEGELYCMDIKNNTPGEIKLINKNMPTDISSQQKFNFKFTEDEKAIYFTNLSSFSGEMWLDDKLISNNAISSTIAHKSLKVYTFDDKIAYLYNSNNQNLYDYSIKKLYLYDGKENIEIDDTIKNVYAIDDCIYFLHIDDENPKYSLYSYVDGKKTLLDENVDYIINPINQYLSFIV